MARKKVFVETSVLLSASLNAVSKEAGLQFELKDKFFDESMDLFSVIRNNLAKRLGILTIDVEIESRNALRRTILRQLERKYPNPQMRPPQEIWFRVLSFLLGVCEDRLRNMSSLLERHPMNNDDVKDLVTQINEMYFDFQRKAIDVDAAWVATFQSRGIPKRYRHMLHPIYKRQEMNKNAQILALKKSLPSQYDVLFLAQAINLKAYYKSIGAEIEMYLASCDTLLSPKWIPGGLQSREITDEIQKRFNVHCDGQSRFQEN